MSDGSETLENLLAKARRSLEVAGSLLEDGHADFGSATLTSTCWPPQHGLQTHRCGRKTGDSPTRQRNWPSTKRVKNTLMTRKPKTPKAAETFKHEEGTTEFYRHDANRTTYLSRLMFSREVSR